jgi:hypothetical protein
VGHEAGADYLVMEYIDGEFSEWKQLGSGAAR